MSTSRRGTLATCALLLVASALVSQAQQVVFDGSGASTSDPNDVVDTLSLYHRFTSNTDPTPRWTERGHLALLRLVEAADDDSAERLGVEYRPLDSAWDAIDVPSMSDEDAETSDEVRYELSIRRPRQVDGTVVSIEAECSKPKCRLFTRDGGTIDETIVLQTPSTQGRAVEQWLSGFEYATRASTSDACRRVSSSSSGSGSETAVRPPRSTFRLGPNSDNIQVRVREAFSIPNPELPLPVESTTPVKVDERGKVIPPPPPKSFIQKYWLYIVPVLIVLMMGGADEGDGKDSKK